MDQGHRSPITDCAMRSHFVVLSSPFFDLFTGVVQIQEPVPAETFQSHGGVEALHISIVGRLAWPAEVERDPVRLSPSVPLPRSELATLIDTDRRRQPIVTACLVKCIDPRGNDRGRTSAPA